jgi:hypothetical protein
MEILLRGDFLNEEKVSKIESIKNNNNDSDINDIIDNNNSNNYNYSKNFNVKDIELNEDQIDFIKNSLINHFIFKDMSNDIMYNLLYKIKYFIK